MKESIQRKSPGLLTETVILHNKACPQIAHVTLQLLQNFWWECIVHPPYTAQTLWPSDFHLFRPLKKHFKGNIEPWFLLHRNWRGCVLLGRMYVSDTLASTWRNKGVVFPCFLDVCVKVINMIGNTLKCYLLNMEQEWLHLCLIYPLGDKNL